MMKDTGSHRRAARGTLVAILVLTVASLAAAARPAMAQASPRATHADSLQAIYRRAQRLVNDGQGAEGRALVDSMLNAAEPRSPDEAEALFWRAMLAESWEGAQRDYLRIMLEHDRSSRAGDAMLRLAQGEAARGDRDEAVRYLERLAREAPESDARAEGALWHGRLLLERGDRTNGCSVLRTGRALVRAGQLEMENQYEYLIRGCPEPGVVETVPVAATAPPPSRAPAAAAPAAAPATKPATTPTAPSTAPPGAPMWSVQVAAVSTSTEATTMVKRLRDRGYDARVDGSAAPYRVRFGRFPTRAAATSALERYKTKEKAAAFLVEVPRG
ncbi:MAG: SPOR domain-containing protein [Gemmatimonadetes bacterium]|nr:SPOR domain-containing protein [Gemmatimonadota bacterium]